MRFFEFKLPSPGSDLNSQIQSELNAVKDIVKNNPESADEINAELAAILSVAQQSSNDSAENNDATDEIPSANIEQPEKQTNVDEAATIVADPTSDLINKIMSTVSGIKDAAKKKMIQQLLKDLHTSGVEQGRGQEFVAGKEITNQLTKSAKLLAAKISGTLAALKAQYDEQIKEGDPQAPKRETTTASDLNEELVDLIESIFKKPITRADSAQQRDATAKKILDFMNRCQEGILDLRAIVNQEKGNVLSGISGSDKEILDMLENALMKAKPGKTAGNWGPGELGLAILGTPVNKASKGDLDVGGEMIELKASQNPKKGGRLGTTSLARGKDGKSTYLAAIKELMISAGYNSKTLSWNPDSKTYIGTPVGKGRKTSFLSFGQTFVEQALNPKIKDRVSPDDTKKFLEKVALSCIIDDSKKMVKTAWVSKCVNSDGTINLPLFNIKYAGMLFSLYQRVDGVGKIMVLNPITGSFYILNGPADLESAAVSDGKNAPIQFSTVTIDFNDSQGKASPQIGI
jgi:hypothetical protein